MGIIVRANPDNITQIAPLPGVRNETVVRPVQGIAEVGNQFAGLAQKKYQEESDKADVSSYMEAQRKLSDWSNNWNDPNNATGVQSYKGRDALKLPETMIPDFDKTVSEVAYRLPSERARQKFKEYAAVERDQMRTRINSYATSQNDASMAAEREAFTQSRTNDLVGALSSGDGDRAVVLWATALDTIHADAAANGRPKEETAFRVSNMLSTVHVGTIESVMVSDPVRGEAHYRRYYDQILPTHRAQIERALLPVVQDAEGDAVKRAAIDGGPMPDALLSYDGPSDGKASPKVPAEIRSIIEQAADRHGVPRTIALAMAEQESGFNPGAVGPETKWGKARGLYQYLDSTAQAVGINALDPAQSADAAMRQLAEQAKGRDWDKGVAHHHAGPDPKQHGPKTRAYVEGIRAKSRRYGDDGAAPRAEQAHQAPAKDETEALQRIQRIADPRLRKVAEGKIRDEYQQRDARQKAAAIEVEETLYQKATGADPSMPLRQVFTPNELAYAARSESLMGDIKRFRAAMSAGPVHKDDAATVDHLYRLQATDPKTFAATNIFALGDRLTGKTLKTFADQQTAARKGKAVHASDETRLINAALGSLGIKDYSKTESVNEADQARGQFVNAWMEMKQVFKATSVGNRDPNTKEMQELLRSLTLTSAKTLAERSKDEWKEGKAPLFARLAPGYGGGLIASAAIPDDFREKAIATIRKRGVAVTDEAIQSMWNKQGRRAAQ